MKKKQIAASLLALTVACSMTACSGKPEEAADTTAAAAEQGEIAGDTNNDGQIDMGVDENVEVKQENASEHMDSFEASTSGNGRPCSLLSIWKDAPLTWQILT